MSGLSAEKISQFGDELYTCLRQAQTVRPLTEREPALTVEDAYKISLHSLHRRLDDGEKVIGKKIGVTSKAVQQMLNVYKPDFGYLTDTMVYATGQVLPLSDQLIQARAEGELAFLLKEGLVRRGISTADVLRATDCVMPCFEIVDSRIENWEIKIEDTIADNASSAMFVLGDRAVSPDAIDLTTCGMVVEKNGEIVATGAGAAAMGNPVNCVAWLANTLGRYGIPLKAVEVILSGSLVPLIPVQAGDHMQCTVGGIGSVSARFT